MRLGVRHGLWLIQQALVAALSVVSGLATGPAWAQGEVGSSGSALSADHAAMLATARDATARRDFATALPMFERLVQRAPQDADLLIEAARVFGWADRNARAAAMYLQALAAAPSRRADIVPSLAWQTLWATGAGAALPWFTEAAALRPADRDIGWAWAQALNTSGRHREAIAQFGRWAPPRTEGERLDVARALRWAGYEDRAWPLVQQASTAEAQWLRDYRAARDIAPFGYAALERAEDRDGLRSLSSTLGAGLAPVAGVNLEFGARRLALNEGALATKASTFEAAARTRLGEPDAATGTWWPQLILRTHRIEQWQPFTSTLRLKWVPADRWRVDAEHTRELVETPLALANRVTVDVSSLGADWRRDERLSFAGAVARLRFDDGTTRQRLVARGEWALHLRPRLALSAEWNGFQRTAEGAPASSGRGYWNPRRYEEGRLVGSARWDMRPWEWQARLGLASSREVDTQGNSSRGAPHLWELAAAVDAAPSWRLRASIGGAGQGLGLSSAATAGAGYWRRWAQLGANAWF